MIHQYKLNGYNIVVDVYSGGLHAVDDLAYDVIALFESHTADEIVAEMAKAHPAVPESEVREVIAAVQGLKDAGFEVTDRIDVRYTCSDRLDAAIRAGAEMIQRGTLAVTLERGEADDSFTSAAWPINDEKAVLAIRVAEKA